MFSKPNPIQRLVQSIRDALTRLRGREPAVPLPDITLSPHATGDDTELVFAAKEAAEKAQRRAAGMDEHGATPGDLGGRRAMPARRRLQLGRIAWPKLNLRPLAKSLLVVGLAGGAAWMIVQHPPVYQLEPGQMGVRSNLVTGSTETWKAGTAFVLPGLHRVKTFSTNDSSWEALDLASADGPAPAQTVEGLSIGVSLKLRYAIDLDHLSAERLSELPEDVEGQILVPAVQATVYKELARHTVREIFSSQRSDIEALLTQQIGERLAKDGVVLRSLLIGQIDLPPDYKRGMEALLTQGLEAEKMRYTLELRDKQVKERELQAQADKVQREMNAASEKVQRELAAEAAAREQVIAAKAQEEAMKHVLPFKERQIEQRKLEAEASRVQRIKQAEAEADARRIQANAEADARKKLADAEAYRLASLGKVEAEQMAVQGELVTRHPLLIQKTMADRLSDKVQVIIASPPQAGGFIGDQLLGSASTRGAASNRGRSVTYVEAEQ